MRIRLLATITWVLMCAAILPAAEEAPLLATNPAISKTEVVFSYGGYLWSVPARRRRGSPTDHWRA